MVLGKAEVPGVQYIAHVVEESVVHGKCGCGSDICLHDIEGVRVWEKQGLKVVLQLYLHFKRFAHLKNNEKHAMPRLFYHQSVQAFAEA